MNLYSINIFHICRFKSKAIAALRPLPCDVQLHSRVVVARLSPLPVNNLVNTIIDIDYPVTTLFSQSGGDNDVDRILGHNNMRNARHKLYPLCMQTLTSS